MDFAPTEEQQRIREAIAKLCTRFPDDYWLQRDREGSFPADFQEAMARDGWLGIAMPEEFGRAGLGIAEAAAGLTLFYTDMDRRHIEVREIEKMGRHAVDSNQVFFDALPVPEEDRIGEEGKGFEYILHGMNPERILIAAELVGLGRCAVNRAAAYAKTRIVFDRPIGQNQAIQHPLAANWMALEAANLMAFKAAWLYDSGKS